MKTKVRIADRLKGTQEYYFSKKMREIEELNIIGEKVINLGIGSPDTPPSSTVIETLINSTLQTDSHAYQSYRGIPELREAMSSWYDRHYKVNINPASEILPLIGSKEGIMHICMTYLDPGDEVLIPNPGYPAYEAATRICGGKVVKFNLREDNDWNPDISEIKSLISSRTKLIWLNYPNMPTGAKGDPNVLRELIVVAQNNGILICNDNPYSLTLNDQPLSILSIAEDRTNVIELNSLSKSHSMAGWRLGMLIGKQQRINEILQFKSNMDSGMFLPIQKAAVTALELDSKWHEQLNTMYSMRRKLVWQLLDLLNCTYNKKQVGLFVWAKIPEGQYSSEGFSDILLYNAKVFVTPGTIFGNSGEKFIRISLCSNETVLEEAIERIKKLKKL